MRWIPPWSLTERTRWAKAHPWVAAWYFGVLICFFLAFVLPPRVGTTVSLRFRIALAVAITPIATVLFGLVVRSRWAGEHALAADNPFSLRRPLPTSPDRLLTALAWITPAAILIIGLDLIVGPVRRPVDFISLAFWVGLLALVTFERRYRRRGGGAASSPRAGT